MMISCRQICSNFLASVSVVSLQIFAVSAAMAQIAGYPPTIDGYDPREVAMLPAYCKHTQVFRDHVPGGGNQVEIERWYSVLGRGFHSLHHYCWGLMASNRAMTLATSPAERMSYLSRSVGEFEYVIRNVPPDLALLPEIFSKRGENLLRLDRVAQGISDLQQATELKPDYWPPYAVLSDHYKKHKNVAKAREWLEKGLQASPGTRALQQRLAELSVSGNSSSPAPVPKQPQASSSPK